MIKSIRGGIIMKQMNVKTIVLAGLAIAVVFVLTAFVVVPIGQFGYVNLGDSGIMLFASFLNPVLAAVVFLVRWLIYI